MSNHPVVLQIQRELVDEGRDIGATAAGESISQELKELTRLHQVQLKVLQEEISQALRTKDEETRQELEETKRVLLGKVKKAEKDLETMVANYAAEKKRAEAEMREMEREAERDREWAKAKYDQKLAALTSRLQHTQNAPAAERVGWEQEIKKLQDRVTIPTY